MTLFTYTLIFYRLFTWFRAYFSTSKVWPMMTNIFVLRTGWQIFDSQSGRRIYSSRCILYFLQSNLLLSFSNQSKLYLNDKSLILHKDYFFLSGKFIEITLQYWCSPINLLRTFWNIFSEEHLWRTAKITLLTQL